MYYAEEYSDGFWWYKTSPDGEWHQFTGAMYMRKIESLEAQLAESQKDWCINDSLDWNRLRSGARRALNPDNQSMFDKYFAAMSQGEAG